MVISEPRPQNTDSLEYARKVTEQVTSLSDAGVPAKNITVTGASKGAGIAIYVSHLLNNKEINYVIMVICHPDNVTVFVQDQIFLYGNVFPYMTLSMNWQVPARSCFLFRLAKGLRNMMK